MIRTIGTFGKQVDADLAIALLRGNGFHPPDLRTSPHATLFGAEQAYYVTVPESEAKQAIDLLEAEGYEKNVTRNR
jgi:hypothetical protein